MKKLKVFLSRKLLLVDRVARWWLMKRGNEVIDAERLKVARRLLATSGEYVARSGHLNTVRGRRPRAVARLTRSFLAAAMVLEPTLHEPGYVLRWRQLVPAWLARNLSDVKGA